MKTRRASRYCCIGGRSAKCRGKAPSGCFRLQADESVPTSGTAPDAFAFCESIVNHDSKILIASLLKNRDPLGWFVRPGTPIPDQTTSIIKAVQAQLVASVVKENESYLGKMQYILVRQELADIGHILVPLLSTAISCNKKDHCSLIS